MCPDLGGSDSSTLRFTETDGSGVPTSSTGSRQTLGRIFSDGLDSPLTETLYVMSLNTSRSSSKGL